MKNLTKALYSAVLLSLTAIFAAAENPAVDLLKDEANWSYFSPREAISTGHGKAVIPGSRSLEELTLKGNGNPYAVGCWMRSLPLLEKGKRYRFEASFSPQGIDDWQQKVFALITRAGREHVELRYEKTENAWNRMSVEFTAHEALENLELRLYLARSPNGSIRWRDVRFADITRDYQPRLVRMAAISGRPTFPATKESALQFYLDRMEAAGEQGVDLLCLPENMNVDQVPGDRFITADPIPGPATERIGEMARKYRMYVVAGMTERSGDQLFNTAILFDRNGDIVGKYNKTHLTIEETLVRGILPGNTFPIFETDFGRLGLHICYDNHFPEVARIYSIKSADVLALPNMSDGREKGAMWESIIRTRAVDNHLHIVSAVNYGRSLIVNAKGEILDTNARYTEEPGDIVYAECDLDTSVSNWSGRSLLKRYQVLRRPDIYGVLGTGFSEYAEIANPSHLSADRIQSINDRLERLPEQCADTPLPDPVKQTVVSDTVSLTAAIEKAVPGEWILIKKGSRLDAMSLDRDFPADQPLVISAEEVLEVVVAKPWEITGRGYVLRGLKWEGLHNQLKISGSHIRVTRCAFLNTGNREEGSNWVIDIRNGRSEVSRDIRIDRCEIGHFRRDGIGVSPDGEIKGIQIDHNYLHHHYGTAIQRIKGCPIYIGTVNDHREKDPEAIVAYNYLTEINGNNHAVHAKSSGGLYAFNWLDKSDFFETNIGIRHGRDNIIAGNRMHGGGQICVKDYNTVVIGNEAGSFRIDAGNIRYTYDHMRHRPDVGYSTKPAARNTWLAGNSGDVLLGFHYPDACDLDSVERTPVGETALFQHKGGISRVRRHGFDWSGTLHDFSAYPAPLKLRIPEPVDLSVCQAGPEFPE